MNIHTEVEYTVESVAIMVALAASHPRAQLSAKNLVHPGRFCKFRIDFSTATVSTA